MQDIDLTGVSWTPIGGFTGHFEGSFFAISNLTGSGGLFGSIGSGATIQDLALPNLNITNAYQCVGGLSGRTYNMQIKNVSSSGNVSGTYDIGGLVGCASFTTLSQSYSTATISASDQVGGIVGYATYSSITNDYATSTVSGEACAGLVGNMEESGVSSSYSIGSVSGSGCSGLIAADAGGDDSDSATNSFWNITTSGQPTDGIGATGKTTLQMQTAATYTGASWDTTVWSLIDDYYPIFFSYSSCSYTQCGLAGNGCYDNATAVSAGHACLRDNTQIDYVPTGNGFYVWQEHGRQGRILQASGLWAYPTDWQQTLKPNGKGFSGISLPSISYIAGRACPAGSTLPSVYIDDSDKVDPNYCLYYDAGNPEQDLNAAGTSQTVLGQIGLGATTTPLWYEGNVDTCAQKGMRLPTLYETATNITAGNYPTDATPTFAQGNGVPGYVELTATASGSTVDNSDYLIWEGVMSGAGAQDYNSGMYIRCVLP